MATVAPYIAATVASYLLGRLANTLLAKDPETPIQDTRPRTLSEVGTYIPFFIGRDRLGANVGDVWDDFTILESAGSGGKGFGAGGSNSQLVYFESGWHRICVGGGKAKWHGYWDNGVYTKFDPPYSNDPEDAGYIPSGSIVDLGGIGSVYVYWGDRNQPALTPLASSPNVGFASSWPWCLSFIWVDRRLGGVWTWPLLEYDIEMHPYLDEGSESRIQGVADWFKAGVGPAEDPEDIGGVYDSFDGNSQIEILLPGDKTSKFTNATYARIRDCADPECNRDFPIASVTYSAGDPFSYANNLSYPRSNADGSLSADTFGFTGSVGWDMDDISIWVPGTNMGTPQQINTPGAATWPFIPAGLQQDRPLYLLQTVLSGNGNFAEVVQDTQLQAENLPLIITKFEVYVLGVGSDQLSTKEVEWIQLEIRGINGGDTKVHSARFNWNGGGFNVVNSNGGFGTFETAGTDPNTGKIWWKLIVRYANTTGTFPSTSADELNLAIKFGNGDELDSDGCALYFFLNNYTVPNQDPIDTYKQDFLEYNDGVVAANRTTVLLDDPVGDFFWNEGTIDALSTDYGLEGANAVAILHQLFFAPYPHGANIDSGKWDLNSFIDVGTALGENGEALRSHVLARDGQDAVSTITNILTELSCLILFDKTTGLYKLKLIREVAEEDILSVPARAVLSPKPEKSKLHSPRSASRTVYSFTDLEKEYRKNTVPVDDDGQAIQGKGGRLEQNTKLIIPRDKVVARKIGLRRSQEDMETPTSVLFTVNRLARDFEVGEIFQVEGEEESWLILEQTLNTDTSQVELDVVQDIYGKSSESIVDATLSLTLGSGAGEDLFVKSFELPILSALDQPAVELLRIRANRSVIGADVWVSIDNVSYQQLESETPYVGGARLLEDFSINERREPMVEYGPYVELYGDDLPYLARTLQDKQFYQGRQLMRINDELMYIREIESVSPNIYRLRGILRARQGTEWEDHSANDVVMIYPAGRPTLYLGSYLQGDGIYFKVLPRTAKDKVSLDTVSARYRRLKHTELSVLPVVNLRANNYSTGEDVTLTWNNRLKEGIRNREAAGAQTAGEEHPAASYSDYTLKIRLYESGESTVLHTYELEYAETYTIPNSDILSYIGSETDFDVTVTLCNKRESAETLLGINYV